MDFDFAAQKAETFATFAEIQGEADIPEAADVDYMFVPDDGADWDAFEAALDVAGFDSERELDNDAPYLVAILVDQPISALNIWMGEDVASKIALQHGFKPDGWGFSA